MDIVGGGTLSRCENPAHLVTTSPLKDSPARVCAVVGAGHGHIVVTFLGPHQRAGSLAPIFVEPCS